MTQETGKRTKWSDEEWEQFAMRLASDNPGESFFDSPDLPMLTCRMLCSAGEKMSRPREFFSIDPSRDKLAEAFARLRAKGQAPGGETGVVQEAPRRVASPTAKGDEKIIRWDEDEWNDFVEVLHEDNPMCGFLHSPDLANLTKRQMNDAAAQMGRPRHFTNPERHRPKLLEAYARLRAKGVGSGSGKFSSVHRAPPPAPPASPLKLDENNRPLPVAKAPAPAPAAVVAWNRCEWLAIATEIDREYPGSNYPNRAHLAGLTSEDVAFAQRVLPIERQIRHIKVASFSTLLPALQDAFRELKQQRIAAEAEHAVLDQAERDARSTVARAQALPQPPAPAAVQAPVETPAPAAPVPEEAPAAAAPGAPAAANPVQAAMSLLLDHALDLITERLRPMIADLIDQALLAPPSAPASAPAAEAAPVAAVTPVTAPVQASVPAEPPAAKVAAPAKEPRMRIGIVGHRNRSYANQLERDFPDIEFRWIDNTKEADTVRNCDRVFFIIKFCSHPLRDQVRKLISKEQYMPIMGTLSDMRRNIVGLLHDQSAASHPAPAFTH